MAILIIAHQKKKIFLAKKELIKEIGTKLMKWIAVKKHFVVIKIIVKL